jgi:ribosomal protein S13
VRLNFTPFYIMANVRRICAHQYRRQANWILAMEIFAVGSTTAHQICREAEIDPDGLTVTKIKVSA